MFYLDRPWQQDSRRQFDHAGQTLSAHDALAEAHAALDAYYERLHTLGMPLDYLEGYVVGEDNRPVPRPGRQ
jgi:hypothetical protein